MRRLFIIKLLLTACCFKSPAESLPVFKDTPDSALDRFLKNHERVFHTADNYRAVTKRQVNTDDVLLYEIVFLEDLGKFDGLIRMTLLILHEILSQLS